MKKYLIKARSASKKGFCRAGIKFTGDDKEYEVTAEQLEKIEAEREIFVVSKQEIKEQKPLAKMKKEELIAYAKEKYETDLNPEDKNEDLVKQITELGG